jgi:outer membrane protein OmpA-like peptidoglycan-associated protein
MLNQLVARGRGISLALSALTLSTLVLSGLSARAQFHAERAIDPHETILEYGSYRLSVATEGQPDECDVVLFGYHSRRPGRWSQVSDTVLHVVPHRRHTLIGSKPGYMFHTESFYPELLAEPTIRVEMRPLKTGQRTDILGIHFLGNQDRLHPKCLGVAEELRDWLLENPTVELNVIGHVNGADGRKSRAFYRKASLRRAEVMIDWLMAQGIDAERLIPKGGGADALLFPDPVYAWQHEANRRVEIEVIRH